MNAAKHINNELVIQPLKVIALITIVAGIYALIFEVTYFADFSVKIYYGRLLATIIGFVVLLATYSQFCRKYAVLLIHILLLALMLSFASVIYLLPDTLFINSHLLALTIFITALFLSWDIKNQIIVALYYNIIFAASILYNENTIYFLPNIYATVIFVLLISVLSIGATSINFKFREKLIRKSIEVKEIFDNSIEGMFRVDSRGDIIYANGAFLDILKFTGKVEDIDSINIKNLFLNISEWDKILANVISGGFINDHVTTVKQSDGKTISVNFNLSVSKLLENNQYYFDGSIIDITERIQSNKEKEEAYKKLEEAKISQELKSKEAIELKDSKIQLLAKINHEFKTPINSVSLVLDMIENGLIKDETELKKFTSVARRSIDMLLTTLNNYLDFTKIDANKLETENDLFNLRECIDDSINLLKPFAESKGLPILTDIDDKLPGIIYGDPKIYSRILINLVSNSIKYTKKGIVKIYVKKKFESNSEIKFITSVKDTGIGIPQDKINLLFHPYSRIDSDLSKAYNGAGLGLIISREMIKLLNGNITVKSELGIGSTFSFDVIMKLENQINNQIVKNKINNQIVDNKINNQMVASV